MAKKRSKKPARPKLRRWFPHRGPTWLKLEPAGLATVGGLFFAACSMVGYLLRQLAGHPATLSEIVAGVALTFIVSYAGTGFFVWYMLHLAEVELGHPHLADTHEDELEPEYMAVPESEPEETPETADAAEAEEQT